ncbi:MAG: hypothetical protein A3F67_00595 [Verrucomicrobia bacterium RIFCSPHIGHO2_12_FULL_41_10]|nr:MAG: hypothetical protein A3F67_00595 [Verrucomicrobia bacterium RIFCSPHIGHO2_12_FULL_41_10]HLB34182.1 hypothetical protein [Chthoniobacterales bacterium]
MHNPELVDSEIIIEETGTLPWRVIHLPYPREKQEYSSLGIRWMCYGKIKLPKIFIQRQTLEKQGASVNYDLLCQELESLLQENEKQGYELFSITPSHSGQFSTTKIPTSSQHYFLRKNSPNSFIQAKEALIIVLKRK